MSISVSGSGFISSSTVEFNGTGLATGFVSSSSVTATIPTANLVNGGLGAITVVNPTPGGGKSANAAFTIDNPVPMVANVSPASVVAGASDVLLDVKGTGFVAGSVVDWNGKPLTTILQSAAELQATLPAMNLSGSSADMVTVTNPAPGGGASSSFTFDVTSPLPILAAISPTVVPTGKAAVIALTGKGFEANSVVLWNSAPRPTTFVSATGLQVALSAADLQTTSIGSLSVDNPGPGASTSTPSTLTVTSQPVPTITNATIVSSLGMNGCPQLQLSLTGTNFNADTTIQVNGTTLQNPGYVNAPTTELNFLPAGFVSKPGKLSFTVTNPGQVPVTSAAFAYPPTSPPVLAICATPSPATVYQATQFTVNVQPSEVNAPGNEMVSVGSLPAGLTVSNSSVALSASGATLHFQAAASTATGSDAITLTGTAGAVTASTTLALTVSSGSIPAIFFSQPKPSEVGIPIGGSGSTQFSSSINSISNVDFDITPSIAGLPAGTTASFSPTVFSPGQSVTVTLSAANNAPVTHNTTVTVTGTVSASGVAPATGTFLADVTQPPGSLPNSRTDFAPTAGTPYAAVYDRPHDLIFASNPLWNRVDVLSNLTHQIVKSISIRDPRGIDISQDNSHVWISTDTNQIYSMSTTTYALTTYTLPTTIERNQVGGNPHDVLLALADGTIFLYYTSGSGDEFAGVWDPSANTYTNLNGNGVYPPFGIPSRSGDGMRVFAPKATVLPNGISVYNTISRSVSSVPGPAPSGAIAAVNSDGTRLVFQNGPQLGLYDQNLKLLSNLPGTLPGFGAAFQLDGGAVFSPDGSRLYEIVNYGNLGVIATVDTSSFQLLGVAPAAPTDPVGTSGFAGTATPIAVDANQLVIGIQNYGISFDDATFYQNYLPNQSGFNGSSEFNATYAGPLAGGTVSSLYVYPYLTPDAWFGSLRGSASIAQGGLSFTSPPSMTAGPVNLKFIYPNGTQMFYPQLFSYSTFPQYSIFSGSSPQGGAPGEVIGYGMPRDSSGGTLTVGGHAATITTTVGQYPPLSGEPYPSTILKYDLPPGTNGFSDLQIETPIGTGTLPRAVYYARSVTDYASADTLTSVLLDQKRGQVYLTATDHVDVFSTSANQFVTPIYPAAKGKVQQFAGLALSPDNSELLVANLQDGSLAVINPDIPANTYAISITPAYTPYNNCINGPLYVAASADHKAFVVTGSLPAVSCPAQGDLFVANLLTKTAAQPGPPHPCGFGLYNPPFYDSTSASASSDGNEIVIAGQPFSPSCLYSAQTGHFESQNFGAISITVAGDANVEGGDTSFADLNGNLLGSLAKPTPLYPFNNVYNTQANIALSQPRLNASGSLYYIAYPNYFEIVDVLHGRLLMRFSLTEIVQNTASPIAIDSGGRHIYLITNQGLTVVDLGSAPLAIGHLNSRTASPGTQITIRGSGFDTTIAATIGGQAASVSVSDENTLLLTIPAAGSGPQDITLTRGDGATYTYESGITVL